MPIFQLFLAYNDQYLKEYSSNDRKTYMILELLRNEFCLHVEK